MIQPVMVYGSEVWALTKDTGKTDNVWKQGIADHFGPGKKEKVNKKKIRNWRNIQRPCDTYSKILWTLWKW